MDITSIVLYILLAIAYVYLYFWVKGKCNKIETFKFIGQDPGTNVLLVGGAHGNEPAGSDALLLLASHLQSGQLKLRKGSITILPTMNPCGKKLGIRLLPQQMMIFQSVDLNRSFGDGGEEGDCDISTEIMGLTKGKNLVIDLHEGWGFHRLNSSSMGSGIYTLDNSPSTNIAKYMLERVNKTVTEDYKKFVMNTNYMMPQGSFRQFCDNRNIPYILIETTGQNDIQSLDVRVQQHYICVVSALQYLGML